MRTERNAVRLIVSRQKTYAEGRQWLFWSEGDHRRFVLVVSVASTANNQSLYSRFDCAASEARTRPTAVDSSAWKTSRICQEFIHMHSSTSYQTSSKRKRAKLFHKIITTQNRTIVSNVQRRIIVVKCIRGKRLLMRSVDVGTCVTLILQWTHRIEKRVKRTNFLAKDIHGSSGQIGFFDDHHRQSINTEMIRNSQTNVTWIGMIRIEGDKAKIHSDVSKIT